MPAEQQSVRAGPAARRPRPPSAATSAARHRRRRRHAGRSRPRTHGRVTVREENAAAALEVMSRFALRPALAGLPAADDGAGRDVARADGYLEHPDEAFAAYAEVGRHRASCARRSTWARARSWSSAGTPRRRERRFGVADGRPGAVYTRTGRPFFDRPAAEPLLDRLRAAVDAAGLWDELDTDWLLLDCELLPWSAKADGADRASSTPPVGAPPARALPGRAAGAGGGRRARARRRRRCWTAHRGAARRRGGVRRRLPAYCWPDRRASTACTLAPFQVLAAEGRALRSRSRDHAGTCGSRPAGRGRPGLFTPTRRPVRRPSTDAPSAAEATAWWEELTAAGGEGMVVKPFANLVRGRRGLVQPGLKVRGREYLRIIYGPDYTARPARPAAPARSSAASAALALREYALGLEALDRLRRRRAAVAGARVASSPCSRWSPSRSTRGSDPSRPPVDVR